MVRRTLQPLYNIFIPVFIPSLYGLPVTTGGAVEIFLPLGLSAELLKAGTEIVQALDQLA
jgi:hypothetical protein